MIEYFVEVPNTNIKESVGHRLGDAWGICYDLAQENGFAEVVWYAPVSYTHLRAHETS